ncbi:MAG: type II secretion system F family protein [Agitococcus sp.]|nr:type II secretion system F family protein [Agitococcus sp.]
MTYHTNSEIESAATALGNQLAAGISMREAVARMARLQPKHADLWTTAAEVMSRGGRLSIQLEGIWPEATVAALRAGEEASKTGPVLLKTAQALRVSQQVKKIYNKLMMPLVSFLAGTGVMLFFMIGVIPKLQASLGGAESGIVFKASTFLHWLATNYWPILGLGTAATIAYGVHWFKQPENLGKLIALADKQPQLGSALRFLYFGAWAYQLELLDSAGIPLKEQLLLSIKTLPECYQAGVLKMAEEVEKRGIADSADPDKQEEGDPRKQWPFYISIAFITAHETSRLDLEMGRCAPILIEEGIRQLTSVISIADVVAKAASAAMIAMPLMAYFTQMSNSLTKAYS